MLPLPRILLSVATCKSAVDPCGGDHDGTSTALVIGLCALILLAILLVKLGGPDKH